MKPNSPACGCHVPQPNFWNVRNCRAVLNGLKGEDGILIAFQTAIVHIMQCLDDLEALEHGSGRCTNCGMMIHNEQSVMVFGTRYCMECGTSAVESQAEDEGLSEGLAGDIARQALPSRFNYGLCMAHALDDPHHSYWERMCAACPEIEAKWTELYRHRIS